MAKSRKIKAERKPIVKAKLKPEPLDASSSQPDEPSMKKPRISMKEENGVISLLSDDEDETSGKVSPIDFENDDEIMIVDEADLNKNKRQEDEVMDDVDDEIQVAGETDYQRLPHTRQYCTKYEFVIDVRNKDIRSWNALNKTDVEKGKLVNHQHCDKCYCYVCDKPVSECKNWKSESFNRDDHCYAADKGQDYIYYKKLRENVKNGGSTTSSVTPPISFDSERQRREELRLLNAIGDGPFKPDHPLAASRSDMTKCRKCGYFSNLASYRNSEKPSGSDLCRACGRIASAKAFEKIKRRQYTPVANDILLGKKSITFTIHARDPSKTVECAKYWEEEKDNSRWVVDKKEMANDFFRHRIGKEPTLGLILNCIPVVNVESIPESGRRQRDYGNYDENESPPSVFETEALLLDNPKDLTLLRELYSFDSAGNNDLGQIITAKWNKSQGKGTIDIKAYLRRQCIADSYNNSRTTNGRGAKFSQLLGVWYDVFPFKLSDLTAGVKIDPLKESDKKEILRKYQTGLIPSRLSEDQQKDLLDSVEDAEALKSYNDEVEEISKGLSFRGSSKSDDCGVVADNDISFQGTLKRIASALLVDNVKKLENGGYGDLAYTPLASTLGITSGHRSMSMSSILSSSNSSLGVTSYLDQKELGLLKNLWQQSFRKVRRRCETMNGLLQQLENLGHRAVDKVEGLNVDLFDFQKQAVGWALDREKVGGAERFLWTKLPEESGIVQVNTKKTIPVQVYYSPVLDAFKTEAPKDIRGGLIAAQMGLGKTVISLSLVLENPAPSLPISGSKTTQLGLVPSQSTQTAAVATLTEASSTSTLASSATVETPWPPIEPLPEGAPPKRGSILSRGTLVVCNVSLVGQWIDEAKAKLKDPGLVYSYHGGNRKRDANVLAKNAIVVTTYAVLQSDETYWRSKSNDPNYCAPCEQVRWWRIICDESHSIRDASTKQFKALERLTAANKWCVTGTPMNTTPMDLKSQLRFVGLSYIDKMFSMFNSNMSAVFKSSGSKRRRSWAEEPGNKEIGPFLFFMKNIMIRHSLSQTNRETKKLIMSLPAKTETPIEIEFTAEERKRYDEIEAKAKTLYERVKARGNVNKQYLRLTSALLPLRLSCSGGELNEGQVKMKRKPDSELKGNELEMDLEDGKECSICLEPLNEPFATKCQPIPHIFCKECINGVFNGATTKPCPCCRTKIKFSEMRDVIPPKEDDKKEKDDEKKKGEEKDKEDEDKKKKGKKKNLDEEDVPFQSKFKRLLEELKKVRDNEPESKTLVFSQFTSTLQWMKQELPKHGFQFRTLSGDMSMKKRADALREFQQDPPTTIFLLSMRAGAAGINLTQANRVFLMEPAMNPALEAQAIGRVHRLGQKKPVQVYKMFMKDSFESRLIKVLKRKYGKSSKEENDGEEKKSASNVIEIDTNGADVGHMKDDKAAMAAAEFDALFGITDPEDLPEPKENEEDVDNDDTSNNNDNGDDESSVDSSSRRGYYRLGGCSCGRPDCGGGGYDSMDDMEEENNDCVIS